MRPGSTAWTDEEINTVIALRRAKRPIAEIAKVVNRSFDSVASKISNLSAAIEQRQRPAATAVVATAVVARQFRSRADYLTSTLMGDPLPGRSALDQRAGK